MAGERREIPMEMIVELLNRRFDAVDVRLDDLTDQVRETNGRVRKGEHELAGLHPRVETLRHEMRDAKVGIESLKRVKEETGDNRRIRVWDVALVALGVSVALGLLKLLGKL
jgi:predicted  nucleic acid-binding Zn-ribbon protein